MKLTKTTTTNTCYIGLQLYSEGKLYLLRINFVTTTFCIHIETVNLSDGLYELIPADEIVADVNSVNLTELNQDPSQHPEEPKANFDSAQEGKPRCIIPFILAHILRSSIRYLL